MIAPVVALITNMPPVLPATMENVTLVLSPVVATVPTAAALVAVSSTANTCAVVTAGATSVTFTVSVASLLVVPLLARTVRV